MIAPCFVPSNKTNLYRVLNFRPLSEPSSLFPPMVVGGIQISGFQSILEPIQRDYELGSAIFETYPELSLPELARLLTNLESLGQSASEVLLRYGLRDNEITRNVLGFVSSLPDALQDFLSERDFQVGDIRAFLPSQNSTTQMVQFMEHCVSLRMSKSQFVEACELAGELIELGDFDWDHQLDREKLIKFLKRKRYPNATQKDEQRTLNTKKQRWPSRSQVNWTRRGDLSGLEIKLFISSPAEFVRAVEEISRVSVEDLWK